jgi:hypothetical protein
MKIKLLITMFCLIGTIYSHAQFPVHVKEILSHPNQTVSVKGNLNKGAQMENLSWAWSSANACFPATQKQKFTGNHVLYHTNLPPRAIMNITVVPENKNANFSVYAYQIGTSNFSTVPDLASCVTCEADHKWDYPKVGKTQDHKRLVSVNSTTNSYNIVIGVVGADGLKEGEYTLYIELQGGETGEAPLQEPVKIYSVKAEKGKITSVKGDLKDGVIIHDLSWAWRSSVACFPETQASKFRGNHVLYVTELPAQSLMEITVVPDDTQADFSLYAYQIGLNNPSIVPNLSSCVSCEADHKWDRPKRNLVQDHTRSVGNISSMDNSYKIVIGVAGTKGLIQGGYTLKITIKGNN